MSKGIFSSSIGRKFVMGLSGLFLITFIMVHLLINLFSLGLGWDGRALFNAGSHFMATNPLIQIMQYVLAAGFIIHIVMGIKLTMQNNAARPVKYAHNKPGENSSFSSRSMIITGMLVLLFLILHIKDFFIEIKFNDLGGLASDYDLLLAVFSKPLYVGLYVFAFIALGFHLNHGFQSAFQSMGLNHSRYNGLIKGAGMLYCVVVALGFSAIAILHYVNSLC
jgi:succinate dehydrogenase / fumarate reductase cytochrome b subunit